MRKYGFGVIGCGVISDTHIKAIESIEEAELVAVCDTREQAARAKADKWGCAWYTDLDQMLASPDIHVVNVVVPSGLHARLGVQAADAGKHVICTKPIDSPGGLDTLIAPGAQWGQDRRHTPVPGLQDLPAGQGCHRAGTPRQGALRQCAGAMVPQR